MARRDQVILTTPITNEQFTAFAYEPIIVMDIANRKMTVNIRLSGASRKFLKSTGAELPITDAVLNTFMTYVQQQVAIAFPQLAGVRTVIEVTDPDSDPVIGIAP